MKSYYATVGVVLSCLLVIGGSLTTYVYAQSAADASLTSLKQKVSKEIERRSANYQKTLATLTDRSTRMSQDDKGTMVGAAMYDQVDGTATVVKVQKTTRDEARQYLDTLIKQLKKQKTKVENAPSISVVRSLAKNIDTQYDIGKLTHVQATVVLSTDSATEVHKNLKSVQVKLQEQIVLMRDCMERRSTLSDTLSARCGDFDLTSIDIAEEAQMRLDSLKSTVSSVGSLVSTAVSVFESMQAQYDAVTKKLGGSSGVQNIEAIGTLQTDAQLQKLKDQADSIKGISNGFAAATSQLDITNTMTVNALNQMNDLAEFIKRK